ncbi:hypothetical protein FOYG_16671 [Fusarium oxysporum NRRL 32931]|uniref:Major facilitator superfamily (MFS) profile domain-containing protein n=1 Tax=Fusarium oxysporum NRRL 32931 TaxID=660029 RepID=W9HDW3_FUSOX|nr:hypothetical protein FOYG_16671 [Fusarium oxysporum NRRL 32931]
MTTTHRSENDSKPQGADPFGHEEIEVVNKQQHIEDAVQYDEAEARRILRKVDYRVVPLLTIMYLIAFIDRANIGNAKIAGMNGELELTGRQYNIVLTVFFIPYALLEVPSNIILKLTRPSIWLPSIMLAWGIVLTLMGMANGRQTPALSSFGNYILIHRLVQQIFFARQSMILFDADDDAPLPPQAMERLESALCAWQRNWEATKDSSLDPLAPGGPLSFNATALFKLAYIRLHTDLGPYRRLETRDPGAIAQAFCTAPLLQRSTGVNRAVLHSGHSLSIPVRIGIEFVARTQTLHWSIVHSLCNLECGLFLAKWLQTIAHALARNEVLDDEETQLLRIITSIINETDLSPTIKNQENLLQKTKNMAAAVVRLWGYSFKGPHVFDIMGTIGAELDLCAEIL